MQRVLEKIAKQLNAYDEASLMQLWHQYALRVNDFEPTKRWEEAAVALCLIQAIRWKNQLFNYHLAVSSTPDFPGNMPNILDFFPSKKSSQDEESSEKQAAKATILRFPGTDQE